MRLKEKECTVIVGERKFERERKKKEMFFILEFLQKSIELYDDFVNNFAWSLKVRTK